MYILCSWVVGVAHNYSQLYHQCGNGSKYIAMVDITLEKTYPYTQIVNFTVSREQLLSIIVRNLHTNTVLVEIVPIYTFIISLAVHGFTSHGVNHSSKDTEDSYTLIRSTGSTKPTNIFQLISLTLVCTP